MHPFSFYNGLPCDKGWIAIIIYIVINIYIVIIVYIVYLCDKSIIRDG